MFKTVNAWLQKPTLLTIALVILCTVNPLSVSAAQSAKKSDLKQLQKVLQQLQVELKRERAKRSKEEQALQKNEQSIAALNSDVAAIDRQLGRLSKNLQGYLVSKEGLQRQREELRQQLQKMLQQRYQMGRQVPLKLLLNQKDPEDVSRMLMYYSKIQQHQIAQVETYRVLLAKQDSNNINIDKTQVQLLKEKRQLVSRQSKLQATKVQRKKNIRAIDKKVNNKRSKIKKLAADKKRLAKILARIAQVVKTRASKTVDKRPFKSLKGQLRWPVEGKIVRRFGSIGNNLAYDGVLIRTRQNSPVKAVHTGKVVFADWLRSYGMLLIVDHGAGYLTLYGHNDQLNKKVGDAVFPGEVIALAGSSGGNTRPGLYFAIRRNGKTTNPSGWLARP
ncbi:MAG: hypothetical protein OFPII_31540 [Osedax symbiont Rs1]|nr:MAG: hypothetical protein OFPII_31540 [Osedax symbiont Rs1]